MTVYAQYETLLFLHGSKNSMNFSKKVIFILYLALIFHEPLAMPEWSLGVESKHLITSQSLLNDIKRSLDETKNSGTNPTISGYNVHSSTLLHTDKGDRVFVSGNTEYETPEAMHSESSLLAQITSVLGRNATQDIKFIAFVSENCSKCSGCGDCRDYIKSQTDYKNLLMVCGQESDRTIHVKKFIDGIVEEESFSDLDTTNMPISKDELSSLYASALEAKKGGIKFFSKQNHSSAAAISYSGKTYKSSGTDDAAFHYRPPISGLLQQSATERDYLIKSILVVGEKGQWPKVSYRDRQYGYEFNLFNRKVGKEPISLIISDGNGNFKISDFEKSLPLAFSLEWLIPEELELFIKDIKASVA